MANPETHRYDATVTHVEPYWQRPEHRQDVVSVIAKLDYANGQMWWLETQPGPQIGSRYTITVALKDPQSPLPGLGEPPGP